MFTDVLHPCLMDGVGLACAVNANWPWISILVTSGYGGARVSDLPSAATYIEKPRRALEILMAADRASRAFEMRTSAAA